MSALRVKIDQGRANALLEHLIEFGGDGLASLRLDLPDWTERDLDLAIDALVDRGDAEVQVIDGVVCIAPILRLEEAA